MTFDEKVKNSYIELEAIHEKGKSIKSKKSRWIGILFSAIIIAYTLIATILKIRKIDKDAFMDSVATVDELLIILSFVVIFNKIVFSIILAFIKKSIFAMNHFTAYRIIDTLANLNLLGLFVINIYNYLSLMEAFYYWKTYPEFYGNFYTVFLSDWTRIISFVATIVINIPVFFKFIKFSLTNGIALYISVILIPFTPFTLLSYIRKNNRVFYEFVDYDEDYYVIRKRVINLINYGLKKGLYKLLFVSLIGVVCFVSMLLVYQKPLSTMDGRDFMSYGFMFILFFCYIVNVLYYYNNLASRTFRRQRNEFKTSNMVMIKDGITHVNDIPLVPKEENVKMVEDTINELYEKDSADLKKANNNVTIDNNEELEEAEEETIDNSSINELFEESSDEDKIENNLEINIVIDKVESSEGLENEDVEKIVEPLESEDENQSTDDIINDDLDELDCDSIV